LPVSVLGTEQLIELLLHIDSGMETGPQEGMDILGQVARELA
jgi:hypothetical protein